MLYSILVIIDSLTFHLYSNYVPKILLLSDLLVNEILDCKDGRGYSSSTANSSINFFLCSLHESNLIPPRPLYCCWFHVCYQLLSLLSAFYLISPRQLLLLYCHSSSTTRFTAHFKVLFIMAFILLSP